MKNPEPPQRTSLDIAADRARELCLSGIARFMYVTRCVPKVDREGQGFVFSNTGEAHNVDRVELRRAMKIWRKATDLSPVEARIAVVIDGTTWRALVVAK